MKTSKSPKSPKAGERRRKSRFLIRREIRYRLLKEGAILESGKGQTVNMCSGGVAFIVDHDLPPETFIELSVSWPVLLDDSCPMRLIVFGRLLRSTEGNCACTLDKYEFRTQAKVFQVAPGRHDSLRRWAEGVEKEGLKARTMMVG